MLATVIKARNLNHIRLLQYIHDSPNDSCEAESLFAASDSLSSVRRIHVRTVAVRVRNKY